MAARRIKLPATWTIGAGGFCGYLELVTPASTPRFTLPVPPETALLSVVYVHPLRRGKGWGDALMARALGYCDRYGVAVASWASPIPEPARTRDGKRLHRLEFDRLMAWYESYGFRAVGNSNYILRAAQ